MTRNQHQNPSTSPDEAETRAAQTVVNSLAAAFKAFSFYPVEHSFTRKNFSRFMGDLTAFLDQYVELRLDIHKNSFSHAEEVLFEGEAEEGNPAYLLTRDGLIYLQFFQGITPQEVSDFLNILVRYRNPGEHEDGDIVTAMWQAELEHIAYEEVDIFALEGFEFDLSGFQVTPDDTTSGTGGPQAPAPQEKVDAQANREESPLEADDPALPPYIEELLQKDQGMNLLDISAGEKESLAALIAEQEQKDFTSDVIDVLLIILASQKNKTNFAQVLEFIEHQFFDTMERGAFNLSYKLLNNLVIIRDQLQGARPWVRSMLDDFFSTLAGAENLAALPWVDGGDSLANHPLHLSFLWKVLRLLPPDTLSTLGPLAGGMSMEHVSIRNELLAIIESKAAAAPDTFLTLMERADEDTALLLLPVTDALPQEKKAQVYLQLTRHPSAEVRRISLDGYMMSAGRPEFAGIYALLGDDNPQVRQRMIGYLFDAGAETASSLLLRFLEQAAAAGKNDRPYIFEYYKALAHCGMPDCLPFLERILLKSNLGSMFGNFSSLHKKGAAMALKILGTREAQAILDKGRQSMRPDIRLACQHVLEKEK